MTRFARLLPLLFAPGLSGCVIPIPIPVPEGTPGSIQIDPGDPCGARGLRGYLGEDRSAVDGLRVVFPGNVELPVRVLAPGDTMTTDVNPERVNFNLDSSGRVATITCG